MFIRTPLVTKVGIGGSSNPDRDGSRPRVISLLLLSAWCGLVAGLLEVGTIALRKQVLDSDHLYRMSRHFIWLIPLSNLCVFLTLGILRVRHRLTLAAPRSLAVHARIMCACRFALAPGCLSPRLHSCVVGCGVRYSHSARSAH